MQVRRYTSGHGTRNCSTALITAYKPPAAQAAGLLNDEPEGRANKWLWPNRKYRHSVRAESELTDGQ